MFLLSCPRSFHPLLEVEIDFHKDIYIYKIVERGWLKESNVFNFNQLDNVRE